MVRTLETVPGTAEPLRLETYFAGTTHAWGVVEDLRGALRREFSISIEGVWDGKVLTLDESFLYADGETERRVWTITPLGEGRYEGTAPGVIGIATGAATHDRFSWQYRFALPMFGKVWNVHFRDRFFLRPNGLLLNIASVSKLGVTIATVTTMFQKQADAEQHLMAAE